MRRRLLFLVVMIFCACAAWGQEAGQIVIPLNDDYAREWLVLGPFFPDDLDTDFLAEAGGEARVEPKEGDTITAADGRILTWKRYATKGNIVDLLDAVGDHENATAYAFCVLQSEAAGDVEVHLGNDNGVVVWINGKQVHSNPVGIRIDGSVFEAGLKAGANRCLVKVSQEIGIWNFSLRMDLLPPDRAVLSGVITDRKGEPIPGAAVRLEQDGVEIAETLAETSGSYRLNVYPVGGLYDLSATEGERGDRRLGIRLSEGRRRRIHLTLKEAISIEGTLLMLDDATPHAAVPVQAMSDGEVIATTLSDEGGKYLLINLKPGRYQMRCQVLGGYVYYRATDQALRVTPYDSQMGEPATGKDIADVLQVRDDRTLSNIDLHFAHFKKGTWKSYDTLDGLAHERVSAIHRDPDGVIWFGTLGGVSSYDGQKFVNFTVRDGLADNTVYAIDHDPDGAMWFGTQGGVSRYDGQKFVNFTVRDGLADNNVYAIDHDPDGAMWFGTQGGVSRYDGQKFVNFTTKDGLAQNEVWAIHRDPDGVMWFGTTGGVSRYDGKEFVSFTTRDGLAHDVVYAIHGDPDGVVWLGADGGVSRYDGKQFVNFTTEDGLAGNQVRGIHRDPDGVMWFGTEVGVSRYDGKTFVNFAREDGLAHGLVFAIHSEPNDVMWFGTWGGVSRYDGKTFVSFTTRDGLAGNNVRTIHHDPDGVIWFGTEGSGISRYDGKEFINFTAEDGLAHNRVSPNCRDSDGMMWSGTSGRGASCYDGIAWASLDTRDGLVGNEVFSIHQDADGFLWFATGNGVTRYRRNTSTPRVRIVSVTTDETYHDLSAVPVFPFGTHASVEYSAIDFKTLPDKRQYRCRIKEIDSDWSKPTKATFFDHTFRKAGTYTFEVQAIDRDLNYSEAANMEISISPPPFYRRAWFIIGFILVAFLIPTGIYGLLFTRKKEHEFEQIPNPYIVGNPIRSKEMFFGRRGSFEFLRAKLAIGRSGQVIVFAGERGVGKTSILFQILNGELGERFVPVLLDMQAMTADSEAEFLEKIAGEINGALGEQMEIPTTTFREGDSTRAFEQFIARVMELLGGRALLLLLDEYELIESKIDDGVLRPDLITFFASLLEAHPRLSLIFTGSRHLEQRNPAYWHVLTEKSLYRHISFLSERDTLRLITEPLGDQVIYPQGIPERIFRLTAGHPFYTQAVCQNLVDRLNELERNRVRQEDVIAVGQELSENSLPQMIYFWDGLEPEQQSVLSLLGEVLEDSTRYTSAETLLSFAREHNLRVELEASQLEQILDELFVREILERESAREGQYVCRFRVDLFRLWIRQAHSVCRRAISSNQS